MPRVRPTESSWDSDEDLLKDDDSISLNVYPTGKDLEELDEDALLAGSDEETFRPTTNQTNVSQSLSHPEFDVNEEELIELEADDADYLEESVEIDSREVNTFLERNTEESTAAEEQLEVTLNTTDDISQLGTSEAAAGYERAVVSSDEDSDEDKEDNEDSRHRARFRSERPEAQRTTSSSQPKADIPDTLELSKEQQEEMEEFMQQRPWQKGRGGGHARARRIPNSMTTGTHAPLMQQPMRSGVVGLFPRGGAGGMLKNRFPLGNQTQMNPMTAMGRPGQMFGAGDGFLGATAVDAQRHKILINPHFRGSGHNTQLEPQRPWASSQNSSHSLPFQQQQQMLRMAEAPSQPPQSSLAPFRPLMSVNLTQRRPLLPQQQLLAVQRAPVNQPRSFVGVPQSFTSQPYAPAQLQFQQQTGIRPNFVAQRRPVTMFIGSSFQQQQQPPLVPSSPSQHLQQQQQQPQFIPGQQMQTLTQNQSPIVHNLQSSQQMNFSSQVQSQIVNNTPRPNIQASNFVSQQQTPFLSPSFSGPVLQQEFGIAPQPQLNRIVQQLPGQFIQQTTPPRIQLSTSVASHPHGIPVTPGAGDIPSLLQGFAGGVRLQRMPQMEEVGQPIETVVHRKVQSRGGLVPAAQQSFSGLPKLGPGARFTANRLSVFGGVRRPRQMGQLQVPRPMRIAAIQPSAIHMEPTVDENSADFEQMQKLEERARRFAQPPPALVVKPATKRPSDALSNDPNAPAAKQAKLLASRKALAKAAFLKKRRELLAAQQQRRLQQQQLQQRSLSIDQKPELQLIDKDHDAELQRGLEQQKLLREKFLKMKEQRRLQQASLRRKELEQRFRAEGLSDDQIKAKFDSDSSHGLKSAPGVDAVQSASTAAVSAPNPGAFKPTVAKAVGKKPTKTIVMTKSQYEAMVRNMKDTDFVKLGGKMPTGISGRTRPNLPVGQERFPPPGSSQRTGAFAVTPAPRSTEPQFQPRGKFTSMARLQKVAPVPLRAATTASTLAPRLGDSGVVRQRAVGSFVWQSRNVRPTIRQNASAVASANQNRRVVFGAGDRSLLSSSVVSIEGLALATTAQALVQLAQKVGPVQHVQLMNSERKALLRFHNAEHATLFAKGYNRHMLDLSMIKVTVVPP